MKYYCDESCHLLSDNSDFMVIGALYCGNCFAKKISLNVRDIKIKHGLKPNFEIKATKVSDGRYDFYYDLIDYFLSEKRLYFRAIIINKKQLEHKSFEQTHDDWYYKMYYNLLSHQVLTEDHNTVFMDLKDTNSGKKCLKLQEVLYNSSHHFLEYNVVALDSKSSNILQLSDLLIGLVCYKVKKFDTSSAKLKLIKELENDLGYSISNTNYQAKINILNWEGRKNV